MMISKNIPAIGDKSFEDLKQSNEHDAEYWSARDLQPLLGYSQWRRFEDAIKRAITSCEQSGNNPGHHFAGAGKPIIGGKGAVQTVDDYQLSRFACYLIAQNGDPRKLEIAHAQKYFAIQARKQELSEQLTADQERLELRRQTSEEFKMLSGAARQAGVQDKMFGVFHDAGYKGLYGGLGGDIFKRVIAFCGQLGNNLWYHFADVGKPITPTDTSLIKAGERQHKGALHAIAALS